MPTMKLTKSTVESQLPLSKDIILNDTEVKGFQCKVTPKGKRVYQLYYRTKDGKERRPKIGVHGEMTLQQARERAQIMKAAAQRGEDPGGALQMLKSAPRVEDLCDRYLEEYAKQHKKPKSVQDDTSMISNIILPAFRGNTVTSVSSTDIGRLHNRLRSTPYRANRVVALLSKMFNLAEQWGLIDPGTNPARFVKKFKEESRQRFLDLGELERLGQELDDSDARTIEEPQVTAAIRLLLLTGCRLDEIRTLKWDHVDWERGFLRLPDTKTGHSIRPLGQHVLGYLANLRKRSNSEWVIPGKADPTKPWVNMQKAWRRIRKRCDLNDVRLHDLRHTHAASAAGIGTSLPLIGKLLGHTQASTTQIYAHVADDPLRDAADKVSGHIFSTLFKD
jgi:integrase